MFQDQEAGLLKWFEIIGSFDLNHNIETRTGLGIGKSPMYGIVSPPKKYKDTS